MYAPATHRTEPAMEIETTGSRIVYGNRWMRVREDRIERTNGTPGLYSVVEKLDYSLIIPRDDEGVFLVEQYRYPVRSRYWEFPQGTWEDRPEADPLEVAREELEAETGLLSMAKLRYPLVATKKYPPPALFAASGSVLGHHLPRLLS